MSALVPLTNGEVVRVVKIDPQRRSVWTAEGRRYGFAAARRLGIDVEGLLADQPTLARGFDVRVAL